MRGWIPVSTSPKGRLALVAVRAFGARPFDDVTVGELAAEAQVTTGALYHHFGSKLGLYAVARADVEQRLLDRMEGAIAAAGDAPDRSAAVQQALLVGLDFAIREGFLHILGDPPPGTGQDRLAAMLSASMAPAAPLLGRVLAAAWRAALAAVADGAAPADARAALLAIDLRIPPALTASPVSRADVPRAGRRTGRD